MWKYIAKRAAVGFVLLLAATLLIFWLAQLSLFYPNIIRSDPKGVELGVEKPVIYLYPEQTTDVFVDVTLGNGDFICTYPSLQEGWTVTAEPDGTLTNKADGREYSYLFWEADSQVEYDFSTGFVVKGSETAEFLQKKLAYMGLTPKEYNEFIVYWLPKMESNPYNLITFQGKPYTDNAVLTVEPTPDSILRVFMAYKPLEKTVDVPEQTLQPFTRKGFCVIEWGGTEVPE